MFNIMLDRLPDEYKGYLIRTDFRIGIQIIQALNDIELSDYERTAVALGLLYGNGIPQDIETAYNGLMWFICCDKDASKGNNEVNIDENEVIIDYDFDNNAIYSAFLKSFHIDLKTAKLHWWEFNSLISDVNECILTKLIDIRTKKITSDMSISERSHYQKLKKAYAIPKNYNEEQREKISEFIAQFKGGEDNK